MKTIEEINQSNLKKIISERKHPDFFPGDIVKVGVRITEGKRDREQDKTRLEELQKQALKGSATPEQTA